MGTVVNTGTRMAESFLSPFHNCPAQQMSKSPLRLQEGGPIAYVVISQAMFLPHIQPHSCEVMHRVYRKTPTLTFCSFASMGASKVAAEL